MIRLPSLLFLETDPRIECDDENDERLVGTTHGSRTGSLRVDTITEATQTGLHRSKRRLRKPTAKQLLPYPPMRLQTIPKSNPPRYEQFAAAIAPFWERQQHEAELKRSPRKQMVASIRRKSVLFSFLWTLASFVAVDDYTLLPTGTLLYVVALTVAWENWNDEVEENKRYLESLQEHKAKLQSIQREIRKAQFEYHVLRNQPHVDIVALRGVPRNKSGSHPVKVDPSKERWIVYADERKHR